MDVLWDFNCQPQLVNAGFQPSTEERYWRPQGATIKVMAGHMAVTLPCRCIWENRGKFRMGFFWTYSFLISCVCFFQIGIMKVWRFCCQTGKCADNTHKPCLNITFLGVWLSSKPKLSDNRNKILGWFGWLGCTLKNQIKNGCYHPIGNNHEKVVVSVSVSRVFLFLFLPTFFLMLFASS